MGTSVPTTISQRENTSKALDLLAVQRYLYSRGKAIQFWHMIASVPVVILLSLASNLLPELKPYAAGWGVLVVIADALWLTPWQTRLKDTGAKTQELFDCEVLQLPWRSLKCDPRPSEESIMRDSAAFRQKNRRDPEAMKSLEMWYPAAVDDLPLHLGRLVCQRVNSWWDGTLRRDYSNKTLAGSVLLMVVLVAVGLVTGSTVKDLLLNLAALSPLILLGFRQFRDNAGAADRNDKLRSHAEKLWDDALAGRLDPDTLTKESRDLQDEIFDTRRRNPLVFDWIYKRSRAQRETDMDQIARELAQQARGAAGTSSP